MAGVIHVPGSSEAQLPNGQKGLAEYAKVLDRARTFAMNEYFRQTSATLTFVTLVAS